MVKTIGSGVIRRPPFTSWLFTLPLSRSRHLLCFNFVIYKMGILIVPTPDSGWRLNVTQMLGILLWRLVNVRYTNSLFPECVILYFISAWYLRLCYPFLLYLANSLFLRLRSAISLETFSLPPNPYWVSCFLLLHFVKNPDSSNYCKCLLAYEWMKWNLFISGPEFFCFVFNVVKR